MVDRIISAVQEPSTALLPPRDEETVSHSMRPRKPLSIDGLSKIKKIIIFDILTAMANTDTVVL